MNIILEGENSQFYEKHRKKKHYFFYKTYISLNNGYHNQI